MRGLTEEAASVAIDVATRVLHLPTVRAQADELAAAAARDRVTHRAYLAELLASEVDDRQGRRRERRIAASSAGPRRASTTSRTSARWRRTSPSTPESRGRSGRVS